MQHIVNLEGFEGAASNAALDKSSDVSQPTAEVQTDSEGNVVAHDSDDNYDSASDRGFQVLSVWVERRRFERQKKDRDMPKEDTSRIYRYYAYRSFVSWAYGILGMGKRYELPACVRVAIMNAYPSGNAEYVGFKPWKSGTKHFECEDDDEEWRCDNF
ncbi:hypothetical protein OSTOST_15049 [Ostertagia ostertagi]